MNPTIAILLILAILCVFLSVDFIFSRIKIHRLTKSVDDFIKYGRMTELIFSDSVYSDLQSRIYELETQLIQEKENTMLEAKNNAEFVSDISHQLKTPLAGLRLYCEMENSISNDFHTEKELELIGKMENLIYNVLKLEKIRSDTYVMNFRETEISVLFRELRAEFSLLFPQKNIFINGDGLLRCDKVWLSEAFGNIIKNACEHTKPDGVIDIFIDSGEKSMSIIIEDDGGGVDENELTQLFKRFHRTENASPDSAGIGLSITKAIIEKHHGTVLAENGENGLRIVICFPIIDGNIKI